MATARELVRDGAGRLASRPYRTRPDSPTPRLDAELWLAHILGLTRARLLAHLDAPITLEQEERFREGVTRLAAGEPLPYLTGRAEFYGLEMAVSHATLIPRPETEHLVDTALALIVAPGEGVTVADVGTGCGCIAVALAVHRPALRVYAVDISPAALDVAAHNAERHGASDRIDLRCGHLLAPLAGGVRVDLIVANLPYVSDEEWADLPVGVREYEPAGALRGGPEGLDLIRELLEAAPAILQPHGTILLEIGAVQGPSALALACASLPNATRSEVRPDYANRDRILIIEL